MSQLHIDDVFGVAYAAAELVSKARCLATHCDPYFRRRHSLMEGLAIGLEDLQKEYGVSSEVSP